MRVRGCAVRLSPPLILFSINDCEDCKKKVPCRCYEQEPRRGRHMDGTPAAVDGRAALQRWPLLVVALVGCACGCLAIGEHTRAITFSLLATSVVVVAKPEWRLGSSRQRVRRRLPLNEAFAGSLQKLHTKPPIYSCADFISPAECDALISLASPHLVASTAGGNVESHGRTSKSCWDGRNTV